MAAKSCTNYPEAQLKLFAAAVTSLNAALHPKTKPLILTMYEKKGEGDERNEEN